MALRFRPGPSHGHLAGATVFFDGNMNGRIDSLEPFAITDANGHYSLEVDLRTFDKNHNGQIDADQGQLVVFGGTDTTTDQPLAMPFVGPLGSMITPLTTLHHLAVTAGVPAEEADAFIRQEFDRGDFDYLRQDPLAVLAEATSFAEASTREAIAAYLAHIQLHFTWDLLAGGLQQLLPDDVPGALADKLDLLKGFSAVLVEQPSSETLGEGFGRAIADAWKRINPDSSPEVAELAAKAAGLAGVASREVGTLLDRLRGDAVRNGATPGEVLGVIDAVKQQAFSVYRGALAGISAGLYRITDPEELVATATQRLDAVQEDFLSGAPTPVDVNVAAGETEPLLVSLVGNDWLMKAGAGTLVVNGANTHAGGTFVAAGTLIVSNAEAFGTGPLIVTGGATVVLDVGSQTVLLGGLTLAEGARLDLGEARLEITSIGVQAESLRSWIIAGRAGGTWAGAEGIGSRAAAASPVSQAVGYLVRADRSATVAFTLAGDLDLDLDVDAFDRVQLLTQGHYNAGTSAEWAAGDLNYDGVVNAFDQIAMAAGGDGRRVDAQPAFMATERPATNGQLQVFRSLAAGISWGHVAVTETATETKPRRVFRLV